MLAKPDIKVPQFVVLLMLCIPKNVKMVCCHSCCLHVTNQKNPSNFHTKIIYTLTIVIHT